MNSKLFGFLGCTFLVCCSVAVPGEALAFVYDEAIDGDLPSSGGSPFDLDLGINTVTGEITFSGNNVGPSDFDAFRFNVPVGSLLDSISIDIDLLDVGSGVFSNAGWILSSGGPTEFVTIPSTGENLFESQLPLSSGEYAVANTSLSGALAINEFRTAAYTFSLNVVSESVPEPVPEPASLLGLAAIGAVAAGGVLKKKAA